MDAKRIEQIFQGIDLLDEIDLVQDPTPFGPKYIHEKVSSCRNQIHKVEAWLLEINQSERNHDRLLRTQEAEFDLEFDDLLISDPEIAKLRSVDERKAMAKSQLKGLLEAIKNSKLLLNDLKYLRKSVELKLKNLEKLNSDIRLQYQTIKSEIDLNTKWGRSGEDDDSDGDLLPKPKTPEPDQGESEAVMAAIQGYGREPEPEEEPSAPAEPEEPAPADYAVMAEADEPEPVAEKQPYDDFNDLLPPDVRSNRAKASEALKQLKVPSRQDEPVKQPEEVKASAVETLKTPPPESDDDEQKFGDMFARLGNGSEPVPESWGAKHSIENQPDTGAAQDELDGILDDMEIGDTPAPKPDEPEPHSDVDYDSILKMIPGGT